MVTNHTGNYFRSHIRNTHKSINRKLNRWSGRLYMFPDPMVHTHHSYYSFSILEVYCHKWVNKQQLTFFIRNTIWHTCQIIRSKMYDSYQFHTQHWHALLIQVCYRHPAHSRSNHLSYQVHKKKEKANAARVELSNGNKCIQQLLLLWVNYIQSISKQIKALSTQS